MISQTPDGDEYILIKPDIGLYYPAVDFLRAKINDAANKEARNILPLVLDCESIKGIDYTAVKVEEINFETNYACKFK